ncbi:hypothetical protein NL676_016258 [Syzygium grande]|nr:hypothetical protein NL676_016258 [Syzygium grande]
MEALRATYGDDSDSDASPRPAPPPPPGLPPPPLSLLTPPNSLDSYPTGQPSRVRTFPHVEGNFALHVYIPVHISGPQRKEVALFLKKVASVVPGLFVVDADAPLEFLCRDDQKLEQVAVGREFHISLGRTVPIRVHQIDSMVSMLRQKLQFHKPYWIDFDKWEVFVNDDGTRSFLSLEVMSRGLAEITKQIQLVNDVYRRHNLPEFYKDPRPHISLAWALGDVSESLQKAVEEMKRSASFGTLSPKCIFTTKFSRIECRIGHKTHKICKLPDE